MIENETPADENQPLGDEELESVSGGMDNSAHLQQGGGSYIVVDPEGGNSVEPTSPSAFSFFPGL